MLSVYEKEKIMKKASVSVIVSIVLCTALFCLSGCSGFWAQPGETAAEGHRRHKRNLRINNQEMMQDVDNVMLFNEPSTLTNNRIP